MLGNKAHRHRQDSARRDRDVDLDSPGERAKTSRVHTDLGAVKRERSTQLRDAQSVGAITTAAPEQGPKEFVYLRVKEGTAELTPRCGLVSESLTSYHDLAKSVVLGTVVGGGLGAVAIIPDDRRYVL